jgi:hypothetical protein
MGLSWVEILTKRVVVLWCVVHRRASPTCYRALGRRASPTCYSVLSRRASPTCYRMRLVPLACRDCDRRLYLESPPLYCAVLFIVLLQDNRVGKTIEAETIKGRNNREWNNKTVKGAIARTTPDNENNKRYNNKRVRSPSRKQ